MILFCPVRDHNCPRSIFRFSSTFPNQIPCHFRFSPTHTTGTFSPTNRSIGTVTCRSLVGRICIPGIVSSLSTPPTSFHSISRLVGGASSSGTSRSAARRSWARIVSLGISFCSSMISLRFFFSLRPVPDVSTQHRLTLPLLSPLPPLLPPLLFTLSFRLTGLFFENTLRLVDWCLMALST